MKRKRLQSAMSPRIYKARSLLAMDAWAMELDWRRCLAHRRLSLDDTAVLCGLAHATLAQWVDGSRELSPAKLSAVRGLLAKWRREDNAKGIGADKPSWLLDLGALKTTLPWVDSRDPACWALPSEDDPPTD